MIVPGMLVPSDNDIVGQCLVESVVTVLVDNAVKTWFKKFVHVMLCTGQKRRKRRGSGVD